MTTGNQDAFGNPYNPTLIPDASQSIFDTFKASADLTRQEAEAPAEALHGQQALLIGLLRRQIIGQKVVVRELETAEENEDRPIERCGALNPTFIWHQPGRTYEGTGTTFEPNDFFRHPRKSKGKVVGIDGRRNSLIVKPRGPIGWFHRDWIKVINDSGEPLISLGLANT